MHSHSRPPFRPWILAPVAAALVGCEPPEPEEAAAPGDPVEAPSVWEERAPFPEPRTEVSVTSDGERVYVIGGFLEPEDEGAEELPPAAEDMYAYSPAEDTWENLGPIPEGTHHAGFVHVDGRLYIVGGYRENTFVPTDQVRIYDIAEGEWTDGEPMPTPRGALAYAVFEGRIHTFGGTVDDKDVLDPAEHNTDSPDQSVGTHEVYDPETDSWERLAPLPTARNHHAAESLDGRIFVVAGRAGDDFTMGVSEAYDPEAGEWEERAPAPTGRSGVAVEVLAGWLYLFGGETFDPGEERTFDDAERYHPGEDRWEVLEPKPTARHGLGAAVVDGSIYVVSGGPEPAFTYGTANERYTPPDQFGVPMDRVFLTADRSGLGK